VNIVVEKSAVVPTALEIARQITINSPDSVQSSKEGLLMSQKYHFEEAVRTHALSLVSKRLYHGANIKVHLVSSIFVLKTRGLLILLSDPGGTRCFLGGMVYSRFWANGIWLTHSFRSLFRRDVNQSGQILQNCDVVV